VPGPAEAGFDLYPEGPPEAEAPAGGGWSLLEIGAAAVAVTTSAALVFSRRRRQAGGRR
jgi:hypothetical protein